MSTRSADPAFSIPRVAAALCAIAVLALGLPYAVVQSLHHRRLDAADRQLQAIAAVVGPSLANRALVTAGIELLAGRGPHPVFQDEAWTRAPALPLAGVGPDTGPDPWGNAYLVNIRERGRAWVISAGPDGILQTALTSPGAAAGDDHLVAIR